MQCKICIKIHSLVIDKIEVMHIDIYTYIHNDKKVKQELLCLVRLIKNNSYVYVINIKFCDT